MFRTTASFMSIPGTRLRWATHASSCAVCDALASLCARSRCAGPGGRGWAGLWCRGGAVMRALVVAARRTLQQGSPRADRVTVAVSPRPRRALVWLPEGQTLYSSLVSAFARFGVRAGALQLLGGYLSAAVYHVAVPREDSVRAAEYGPPIQIDGGARLVRATGSYGDDL